MTAPGYYKLPSEGIDAEDEAPEAAEASAERPWAPREDEAEGLNAWARVKVRVCGRVAPFVVADAEGGAWAPEAVDSKDGKSCEPGAFGATAEGARASAAEVSASGGLVLTEASANLEARNWIVLSTSGV